MNTIIQNNNEILDESTDDSIESTNSEQSQKKIHLKYKNKRFTKERNIILNNIYDIIGITETKKTFCAYDLDTNIELQNKILGLIDEISKYFSTSLWPSFRPGKPVSKRYLSIVKSVIKDMDIKLSTCNIRFVNESKKRINTSSYTLL